LHHDRFARDPFWFVTRCCDGGLVVNRDGAGTGYLDTESVLTFTLDQQQTIPCRRHMAGRQLPIELSSGGSNQLNRVLYADERMAIRVLKLCQNAPLLCLRDAAACQYRRENAKRGKDLMNAFTGEGFGLSFSALER
jgi:hypothetical protein